MAEKTENLLNRRHEFKLRNFGNWHQLSGRNVAFPQLYNLKTKRLNFACWLQVFIVRLIINCWRMLIPEMSR